MIGLAGWIAVLYGWLIGPEMVRAVPETDLFWMFPAMVEWGQRGNFWDRVGFLFSPAPINLGQPVLKIYLSLKTVLDWKMSALLGVAGGVHLLNAFLVGWLGRALGLSKKVSGSAGLIYLSSFALFHATLWPTAVQHLLGLFTLLGTLCFYLWTERRIAEKDQSWRGIAWTAAGFGVLSSLQRSAWMGLFLVLVHLLCCAKNREDRIRRLDRWLPMLAAASVYPVVLMGMVGDIILGVGVARLPVSASLRTVFLGAGVLGGLLVLRGVVRKKWTGDRWFAGTGRVFVGFVAAVVWMLLIHNDHRQVLLPYNILLPLSTFLSSFLDPIRMSFQIDSTEPYHYLPAHWAPWMLLASVWIGTSFLRHFSGHRRGAVCILAAWYGVCFVHLSNHYTSFPIRIPSRYFVYLVPILSLVCCSVVIPAVDWIGRGLGVRHRLRWKAAGGFLAILCLANLAAVRVEAYRGRLINSYLNYDDVRTLSVLSENVRGRFGPVVVDGVEPMPFTELWGDFLKPVPAPYSNFQFLAKDFLPGVSLRVNGGPAVDAEAVAYKIQGSRLLGPNGQPAERFWRLWEEGSFRAAVEERPYLLRFLLGSCRLSDVRWMTDGRGLRDWILQIEGKWRLWSVAPIGKWERTREVMGEELSSYAGCFVGLSYEAYRQGREEEARRWLSQLYFLEPDRDRLRGWLQGQEWMRRRPEWQAHLERLNDPRWFRDPLPWTKDDYGFGRFLARLLFNADIRSRWDRGELRKRPFFGLF